jgi:HAD superfamily hydrolase (TIGR01509 family)
VVCATNINGEKTIMGQGRSFIALGRIAGVIFDTDGVVTDTARVHAAAWKAVFDAFLRTRATRRGEEFRPFDVRADYLRHVEGKPRHDGIRDFLAARNIVLPEDVLAHDPAMETISEIGGRKDALFLTQIRRDGIAAYPATVALVRELRRHGARTAAVSASRHCAEILGRAGVAAMFDLRVDAVDAARIDFPGKPHPGLFLEAARGLNLAPESVAVVDDAPGGVAAARRGDFGLVIGLDRGGQADTLHDHGADLVVDDLADLEVSGRVRIGRGAEPARENVTRAP